MAQIAEREADETLTDFRLVHQCAQEARFAKVSRAYYGNMITSRQQGCYLREFPGAPQSGQAASANVGIGIGHDDSDNLVASLFPQLVDVGVEEEPARQEGNLEEITLGGVLNGLPEDLQVRQIAEHLFHAFHARG